MTFVPNHTYEILTPNGFKAFAGLHYITRKTVRVYNGDTLLIEGSRRHRVQTPHGFQTLGALRNGDVILTKSGLVTVTHISTGTGQHLYDPIAVEHPEQAFYTGEVVSHNCDFMGSANTLVAPWKIAQLSMKAPIEERLDNKGNGLRIYRKPVHANDEGPGHIYMLCVDVGEGQEQDYSVLQVIDISVNPWVQVAVWRHNLIKPTQLAPIIRDLGNYYNRAFLFFEINFEGAAVAEIVVDEFDYENLIYIFMHKKRGQQISAGFHQRARFGLKVSVATKRIGCMGLKSLIENDKLILNDYETIRELSTFVQKTTKTGNKAKTYEAETGSHDDTISPLVLLGWLTFQQGFENYVGLSMRTLLTEGHETLTFDDPYAGIFGDLERESVVGQTAQGHDIVDDPNFWNDSDDPANKNWL